MTCPRPVWCIDLDMMSFAQAHSLQLDIVHGRFSGIIERDVVLILEHPSVFTIGRRGNRDHLKVPSTFLNDTGIDLLHIERGGDITFHGPGQIVIYPIFHLRQARLGVVDFVEKLEAVMIRTAEEMGVSACRNPLNHGVWVGDRKMGFVGIAVRRGTSFHGIALNVDLSLEPFTWINPCGLKNIHITSLDLESDLKVNVDLVKTAILHQFASVFDVSLHTVTIDELKDLVQSKQS